MSGLLKKGFRGNLEFCHLSDVMQEAASVGMGTQLRLQGVGQSLTGRGYAHTVLPEAFQTV